MKPLLSVKTITYNHAPYIRRCIEGVLMQKTNFPIEHVIGEDCSTDGTREIIQDYAQDYPETVRVITSGSNVGASENSKRTHLSLQGKYIAFCEGDDYWTDPEKLQKQVDFLEQHPEYSMCCHASKRVFEGLDHPTDILRIADINMTITIDDFLLRMSKQSIRTETVVCKRAAIADLHECFHRMLVNDFPTFLLAAHRGKIRYLDQVMSVHIMHGGGMWTSNRSNAEFQEKYYLFTIRMFQEFDEFTKYYYHDRIQEHIPYRYYQLIDRSPISGAQRRMFFWKYWNKMPKHLLAGVFSKLYFKPVLGWLQVHYGGNR